MSEMYGFGPEDGTEPGVQQQGPKWFRDYMDKVSADVKALREENEALRDAQARQTVRETLTAQGYAPEAANLYTGKPEGLGDWLAANAAALAKSGGTAAEEGQQGVQGTPQTVVSPESQAAQAAFSAAGTNGASPLSTEDQLQARLEAAQTPEEFNAIMREAGNARFR